jgi:hypothetical protein
LFDGLAAPTLGETNAHDTMRTAAERVAKVLSRSQVAPERISSVTIAVPSDRSGLGGLCIDVANDANAAGVGEWHVRPTDLRRWRR